MSPYGYCPICNSPGVSRERRPEGNDRCENGHSYPSRSALKERHPVKPGWVLMHAHAECGRWTDDNPGLRADCKRKFEAGRPCEKCPDAPPAQPVALAGWRENAVRWLRTLPELDRNAAYWTNGRFAADCADLAVALEQPITPDSLSHLTDDDLWASEDIMAENAVCRLMMLDLNRLIRFGVEAFCRKNGIQPPRKEGAATTYKEGK